MTFLLRGRSNFFASDIASSRSKLGRKSAVTLSAPFTFMLSGNRFCSAIMYTLPSALSRPGAASPSIVTSPLSA